ncbi:uncharacterized protein LOC129766247 [Toxorhynchites rutilus septentrionalis]|uniref:uncharacterized protein LOC129766247 n=1 Tax=Toxorhynchites rutilus septentrionalis TaxID=329112 RepID=UPI002479F62A|nr:uncharacterized protein LOC129766247 [Toxorhynchites rutilus septentrionalis]
MSSRGLRSKKTNDVAESETGGQDGTQKVVTEDSETPIPRRSCQICHGENTNQMVRCDVCQKWHHYQCVGVTQVSEKQPWSCAKCKAATGVQDTCSNTIKPPVLLGSQSQKQPEAVPGTSSASLVQQKGTQQSQVVNSIGNKSANETIPNITSLPLKQSANPVLSKTISNAKETLPRKPASNASGVSNRSTQTLLKLKLRKLEEERELERRRTADEAAKDKEFLEKKYKILEEMASEGGSNDGDAMSRVEEWMDETVNQNGNQPGNPPPLGCTSCNRSQINTQRINCAPLPQTTCEVPNQTLVPVPQQQNNYRPVYDDDDVEQCPLTRKQLAARQAISKELPTFSGNPEEWPLFLSSFNSTTAICGFSDAENIIRLQKCLRGRAYEAVKSRLMHPANVVGVITTLKMLFGQPEAIVHTLIAKINSLPALREDKLETLVNFAVSVDNFCATVDACELEEHLYNVSLMHQLVSKLPSSIKLNWAQYRQTLPAVNLASFSHWLYSLAEAASAITIPNDIGDIRTTRSENRGNKKGNTFVNSHSEDVSPETYSQKSSFVRTASEGCMICKGMCKSICKCKRFLEMSRDSRWAVVREYGLCRRCLRRHYGGCQARLCGKNGCQFKHHELLHNDEKKPPNAEVVEAITPQSSSSSNHQGCHTHQVKSSRTLFRYLPVRLHGKHGSICTFAFLDDGSSLTLVDSDLADELRLEGEVKPLCLHWTGGTQRQEETSRVVSFEVAGIRDESHKFSLTGVRTVNELLLPPQTLNIEELSRLYPHLRNLPILSYEAVRPRILIGMKDQHLTLVLKSREGGPNQPLAVKTRLGWTVCGGANENDTPNLVHSIFHICPCENRSDDDLHQAMKRYFSLDSLGVVKSGTSLLSRDEQRAQSLLQSLTKFTGTRFETGLLWRYDEVRLPDSRAMAMRRFQCLEKRLMRDASLAAVLQQKISDYLRKGYIRKLSEEELIRPNRRTWYLPVFPVKNPNKPGKIRIVWDAAATAFGKSLNSFLLTGPDQLASLFSILIQFRERAIGLTGDLREMFHQVSIRNEDQLCQLFFWRDEDGQLSTYVMRVMTFGACCSPSSAQYAKNMNAERFRYQYPTAANVIQKRHYVDDMLVSVDTEGEAIQLAKQVTFVHAQGGFEIRNWISNSQRVLRALDENSTKEKNLDLAPELATEKVLGMWWCTASDVFSYKVGWNRYERPLLEGQRCPTKREMLRILMSMFDPLGLIAQFLMYLKILMQEVWRSGADWDDEINGVLFSKWQTWLQILPQIETLKIPRCYRSRIPADFSDVQLHMFVDASEDGMAAACYLRYSHGDTIECTLVAAKTRVSPLKFHSIPRLELQAAVLGVRLASTVKESLSVNITRRIFWSDSPDVICWVNSDHRRFTPFVAHRVSEILDSTEPADWRWVPTKQNVADDGTKWVKLPDMSAEARWYTGPHFLMCTEKYWPQQPTVTRTTETELRPYLLMHVQKTEPLLCFSDFSSWRKMVNTIAYVLRFSNNIIKRMKRQAVTNGHPSMEELTASESHLIRQAQEDAYPDEYTLLHQSGGATLPKTSALYKLTPWIDKHGIMRIRGRISACEFATEDAKNPIILPRNHHVTSLIVAHYHQKYHHQNHETVINEIRQRYSISRLRSTYLRVRNSCQRCKNNRAIPQPPIMADLPHTRLDAFARPFTHVGVDYFGPITVVIGRRSEKRWGILVTCMTIRAIHIEIVHSLSTNSCIIALRNFISRRGTPRTIYSDRGTNFVGACREMQKAEASVNIEEMMKAFVSSETKWVFLPPLSPHMGGCWERLIGTVKRNMTAILSTQKLTDEVLRNVLAEIENVVNSRPLTHVPIDDDSGPALTPNHFLLGSSDGTKPLCTLEDSGAALRQCWRASQILANRFWKRWLSSYLPEITRRTKWFINTKAIGIDDVVIIADPKNPRNCWPRGKVIGICPGRDGQPRSATVKTGNGVYERPVAKLAVLDVRRDD